MPASDNASLVAHRWIELYDDGTPTSYGSDRFLELYADDCVWVEAPTPFTPEGRSGGCDEIRAALEASQAILVDRHVELRAHVADGDQCAMWYRWSATVSVDGAPVPKGTRLTADVASFFRIRDDRIVEAQDILAIHAP